MIISFMREYRILQWVMFSFVYFTVFIPQLSKVYRNETRGFVLYDNPSTILLCTDEKDMMEVTDVSLIPDPPAKGQNLTVNISGYLKEDLLQGAYLIAKVRKGGIKFPQFHVTACEYLSSGCPVPKGQNTLSMTFEIPKLMPGGGYEIETTLFNKDKETSYLKKVQRWVYDEREEDDENERSWETKQRVACLQGSIEL